jgi:hypothetical protein
VLRRLRSSLKGQLPLLMVVADPASLSIDSKMLAMLLS